MFCCKFLAESTFDKVMLKIGATFLTHGVVGYFRSLANLILVSLCIRFTIRDGLVSPSQARGGKTNGF